jgi:hypothetical protein
MEGNLHKFLKRLSHQTIHTIHPPQTVPFRMAKLHSHAIFSKSWQILSISLQNEKDGLTNLQLS